MSLFDGLKDAQVFEGGNYLGLGIYDLEVIRCLVKPSRASGMVFIAELRVLSSTNPAQPPGVTVSFAQKMQDQAIAFAAIKEFVIALMGFDLKADKARIAAELEPQIGALTDAAVGAQNIFAGRRIHAETYPKETKARKLTIILPRWSPYKAFPGEEYAPPAPAPAAPPAPAPAAPPPYQPPPWGRSYDPATAPYQPPPAPQGYVQPAYPPPAAAPAYPPPAPAAPPPGAAPYWNGTTWVMP